MWRAVGCYHMKVSPIFNIQSFFGNKAAKFGIFEAHFMSQTAFFEQGIEKSRVC
jgi:hypothetical protein